MPDQEYDTSPSKSLANARTVTWQNWFGHGRPTGLHDAGPSVIRVTVGTRLTVGAIGDAVAPGAPLPHAQNVTLASKTHAAVRHARMIKGYREERGPVTSEW